MTVALSTDLPYCFHLSDLPPSYFMGCIPPRQLILIISIHFPEHIHNLLKLHYYSYHSSTCLPVEDERVSSDSKPSGIFQIITVAWPV